MNAISLFAGIGGFDLALERAGIEVIAAVEIDPKARTVLERHFPNARRYEDVTKVTGEELSGGARVDVLCGGWPCQDLSVAGRRAGLAGARSGLFSHVVRLADELRPTWLLLENVPGLLSSNGGRDMGAVLAALGELGYGVAYRVLDARYFGVPQRRRRVIFITPGTLSAVIYQARKEGWLVFDDPMSKLEHDIIPQTIDNLKKFVDAGDKTTTIEVAKGTIFKQYQESKGISDNPITVLALKIEAPEPGGEVKIMSGQIVGTPRRIED